MNFLYLLLLLLLFVVVLVLVVVFQLFPSFSFFSPASRAFRTITRRWSRRYANAAQHCHQLSVSVLLAVPSGDRNLPVALLVELHSVVETALRRRGVAEEIHLGGHAAMRRPPLRAQEISVVVVNRAQLVLFLPEALPLALELLLRRPRSLRFPLLVVRLRRKDRDEGGGLLEERHGQLLAAPLFRRCVQVLLVLLAFEVVVPFVSILVDRHPDFFFDSISGSDGFLHSLFLPLVSLRSRGRLPVGAECEAVLRC